MTHLDQLTQIRDNALNYIKSVLRFRGTNYELTDPTNYEEDLTDEIYQLPRGFSITKHGHYVEYAIVIINIENDELSFHGIEIGEMGDDITFTDGDLDTDTICVIADLVKTLEK